MKTEGLVPAILFVLALTPVAVRAANEDLQLPHDAEAINLQPLAGSPATDIAACAYCGDRTTDLHSRYGQWVAGAEFTFLQVESRSGGRVTISLDDSDTAGVDYAAQDGDGFDGFTYAPRIWLGRQFGPHWGIAGRFWSLADREVGAPALAPGQVNLANFATFSDDSRIEMMTVDLEATRNFCPGRWKVDSSLGARHASISADSAVTAFGVFTPGNFINLGLSNGFSFDGTGVTGSISARRPLGDTPLSLFLGMRTSYLGGHTNSFGRAVGTVSVPPNPPLLGAATVTRNNAESELDINELQVGLQLDFRLRQLPARAFIRTAFEYQVWDIDGPPTGGAGFGGTVADLTTNTFTSAGIGHANLYGLAVATGFTW